MKALEQRIADAFREDAKSGDLPSLIDEAIAAAAASAERAEISRQTALDPTLTPKEVAKARAAMEDAAFTRDRLNESVRRLQERLTELQASEKQGRLQLAYDQIVEERDLLATELAAIYPTAVMALADVLGRVADCDARIDRMNSRDLPSGMPRLVGAEARARGLSGFVERGTDIPQLTKRVALPTFLFDPMRLYEWPRPHEVRPQHRPRLRLVEAIVLAPFTYQRGPALPTIVCAGLRELPTPLLERVVEAGLAVRLDSDEGKAALHTLRLKGQEPESSQRRLIALGELQAVALDFDLEAWAREDVEGQRRSAEGRAAA